MLELGFELELNQLFESDKLLVPAVSYCSVKDSLMKYYLIEN